MKPSESLFVNVRGLRYHVRSWGNPDAPRLFLLHGWWDMSASYQFVVDSLSADWHVLAPDWRGSGLSQWDESGAYWFNDFLGDLDRLLHHFQPAKPVNIAAHSMSFNVSSVYAGVRPERVARLANIDCYGFRKVGAEDVKKRYSAWLATLGDSSAPRSYESFDAFAQRLCKASSHLTLERAGFIARHLAQAGDDGRVTLRGDPAQRDPARLLIYNGFIRLDEAMDCWRSITAPVLWVSATDSVTQNQIGASPAEMAERKSCFRKLTEAGIGGAGHMVHQEQPEALAGALEPFFLSGLQE